jgi:very-short-patch-repair endonuclease
LQLDQLEKEDPLLQDALDRNKQSNYPLFIKNLENVQGDERDVIMISMTYGPETVGGRTMQRFGPINQEVGWRRLNVLVTRSKKRMHVFSSMGSGDILASESSSKGVLALRNFLEYCETGHLHHSTHTGRPADSDFEIAVMRALAEHGYECEPQLGVAGYFLDLAVKDPGSRGRFIMAVECDGATYHSAKSTRDRDRLRQDILETLGWKVMRIWSTDWFKNPEAQILPIVKELDKLKTPIIERDSVEDITDVFPDNEVEKNGADTESLQEASDVDISLRDRLTEFNENIILPQYTNADESTHLLRPPMLNALLNLLPCSRAEFLEVIPAYLREGTSRPEALAYLDEVLGLIADYG